jgi:hypothetical protein
MTPLWSNPFLLSRATALQAYLNAGLTLRLFSNTFTPTPASPRSAFTECTFTGYAPVSLAAAFGAPALVVDGQYQLTSVTLAFLCTSGPGQNIAGWYIDDGANMIGCQAFDSPFHISSGVSFDFLLKPQEISQSIL